MEKTDPNHVSVTHSLNQEFDAELAMKLNGTEGDIEELFQKLMVRDLITPDSRVVFLKEDVSLNNAIKTLSEYKILSAPVQCNSTPSKYLGFVDMVDMLGYILQMYVEEYVLGSSGGMRTLNELQKLEHRGKQLGGHCVRNCVDFSKRDPFSRVYKKAPVSSLLYVFHNGSSRAGVTNAHGDLVGIVTQTDVIRFLAKNMDALGKLKKETLEHLGLVQRRHHEIKTSMKALCAFFLLWSSKEKAVAIVDNDDRLVGNFSVSDLKGLKEQNFGNLNLPVSEFLKAELQGDPMPVVTVKPHDTFETAIQKLVQYNIHQVWVVNDHQTPLGVVHLESIIQMLDMKVFGFQKNRRNSI